ncbi:hypothetical protein Aros01_05764 [Streptosporangium roseum]|uniref:Ribosomal protein L7/L12 C-terminal domain-containing protein n=2 Tax=Streptosporangium roseum TaxID=2001 RepID=D2B1L6_STRRD|nr:hypothetical protein Sros_4448 [Streptosporangium roseum DSM 43021]
MLALSAVVITLIIGAAVTLLRRAPRRQNDPHPQLDASQLQWQATALITAGKVVPAIKLVREQTGLDLKNAKRYVDDLRAGRTPAPPYHHGATAAYPPTPLLPPGHGADLATRVRLLKTTGRSGQAVLLVRGETGMSEPDAQRFVDAIQT